MGIRRNVVDGVIFGSVALGIIFYILWGKENLGLILILVALVVSIFRRSIYKLLS